MVKLVTGLAKGCLLVLCLLLVGQGGLAAEGDTIERGTHEDLPRFALGSVGIAGGFPGYQLYGLRAGVQVDAVGLALRGSYTSLGPYLGLAARYYLPIPIPAPTFVSLEGGVFNQKPVVALTAGAHVPLARNVRLDLEGGVSRLEVLGEARLLPAISLGLSYTFAFEPAAREMEREVTREAGPAPGPRCPEPLEPDRAALRAAFSREVRNFLAEAQVVYAGTYRDLAYSYRVSRLEVEGARGVVEAEYEGSVREILGGNRVETSGTVTAEFRWDGCRWSLMSASY
jgi:hypothetical protein